MRRAEEGTGRSFRLERITPHHYSFETVWDRIDLRYEAAGFQSGWTILRDDAVLGRRADLMNALDAAVRWSWAMAPRDPALRVRVPVISTAASRRHEAVM